LIAAGVLWLSAFGAAYADAESDPSAASASITLSIDEAVARAIAAAPILAAGSEAIKAAEGGLRQAGARPNPALILEAEDFAGSGDFSGFGGGQYTYSVGQQIERGGKRRARRAVAAADRDIAIFSAARTELDVAFSARAAFIEAAAAELAFDLSEARKANLEQTLTVVARRVEAARDPASALNSAAAAKAEGEAALARAARGRRQALDELALLTGLAPSSVVVTAPWFQTPPTPAAEPQGEFRSADIAILALIEERAAAAADLQRANSKQDPTVSLGLRNLQASRDTAVVASVSMPLSIFNRNKGAIARAEAERRQAAFEREAGALALSRDIVRARGELDAASAEAAALARNVLPEAARALASARAGFQRGAFSYLDVAVAETAYFQHRAKEIEALRQAHLAKARFDRLTAELPDKPEAGDE
jgi:cobalt-zinc-cadmium efflux system outer membrane protein